MDDYLKTSPMSAAIQSAVNTAASINHEMNLSMAAMDAVGRQEAKRKAEMHTAAVETADNTAEMKADLKNVIHNQNDYIKLLKEQNEYIKEVLNNLFGSSEDAVLVQKEILEIMQKSKPTDGIALDKGFDVAIQLALSAIQVYLRSKGIFF